jgi:[ribosomal protein S5]-alanine N-acetyltransferase
VLPLNSYAVRRLEQRSRCSIFRRRVGQRVVVRPLEEADADAFLALIRDSRRLHRPWVYPPKDLAGFRRYLGAMANGHSARAAILARADLGLVGIASLSEIVRGSLQSAYLGFFGSVAHQGLGLTREGVKLLLAAGFRDLRLHRIEANVQPANEQSRRLIASLGFQKEGFSPKYLKVGGKWRDHERWALLAERVS